MLYRPDHLRRDGKRQPAVPLWAREHRPGLDALEKLALRYEAANLLERRRDVPDALLDLAG